MSEGFLPYVFFQVFMPSDLLLKPLLFFMLFFEQHKIQSNYLHAQFSPHHLLKRLSFTLEYSWLPYQISIDPLCESLFLGSLFCSTGICGYIFMPLSYCINYCSFGKMDRYCLKAQSCDQPINKFWISNAQLNNQLTIPYYKLQSG